MLSLAQINRATVVGRVSDAQGLAVYNAQVEILRVEANEKFLATTTTSGDYTFNGLPVGRYEIRVSQKGFQTAVRTAVTLETGSTVRHDFQLQVGSVAETVTIEASAATLRTDNPEQGQVINNSLLVGLPNSSRDFASVAMLAGGVAPLRGTLGDSTQSNGFNVQGARWSDNQIVVDGTTVVDGNGTPTFYPNLDALEEVDVKTGLYSAEFGVKPGGQISTVTKSGTNILHGSAFLYRQDENFGARRFFDTVDRPEYKRSQFGAVLSGPVMIPKFYSGLDKMWFLFSYQGYRTREYRNLTANVPTANEKQGQFASTITDPMNGGLPFSGNRIPAGRVSPIAQKFLGFWPDSNISASGYNYVSPNSRNIADNDQFIGKIDYAATPNSRWSGRVVYDSSPIYNPNAFQTFSYMQPLWSWAPSISNTQVFGGKYVNDFSVHLFRRPYVLAQGSASGFNDFGQSLGIPGWPSSPSDAQGVPVLSITGPYSGFGDPRTTGVVVVGNWEAKDNFSFNAGSHSIKTGFHYRQSFNNYEIASRSSLTFNRQFSGNGFSDFLLGYLGASATGGESTRGTFAQKSNFIYIQDDWKATSRLTVSMGLRYELRHSWRDKRGFMTNVDPTTGAFTVPAETTSLQSWETGRFTPNAPLVSWSKNGWMPRLGLAYRATPRTVIRAGVGAFGNEPPVGTIQWLGNNPRQNAVVRNFLSDFTTPTLFLSDPFNTVAQTPNTALANYRGIEQVLPQNISWQWGMTVQQSLTSGTIAEVAYFGRQSSHDYMLYEWNDAVPGTTDRQSRRPFPNMNSFIMMLANGYSSYHGIDVKLNHRPGRTGLTLVAAFTYGKGIDTGGGRLGVSGDSANISRNMPLYLNRGLSEGNIPGRLSLAASYELPLGRGKSFASTGLAATILGGWQVQSQLQMQNGPYINATISPNSVDAGSSASQWPDRLRDPNLPSSERTIYRWFDTTALAMPAAQTYGNAGRSIIQAPGFVNWDGGIQRIFTLYERAKLEFRVESFNLANHANFLLPNTTVNPTNTNIGKITSTMRPRDLQFGLRLQF